MLFILLGGLLVALSAAAIVTIPFRLTGRKTPKPLLPLSAGLALVVFVIWNDYSWYSRTAGELPERVSVVNSFTYSGALQPWTLVLPRVNRFTAIDTASIRRNDDLPGHAMAEVLFVQRYQPTLSARQIFDCEGSRRADLTNATTFSDDGMPENAVWVQLDEDDRLLQTVCTSDE